MKLCKDCKFFKETGDQTICTRPFSSKPPDYVYGRPVVGQPINDLCLFQRQKIGIRDWLDGRRPPNCGYCGPKARFFEKKISP